MSFFSDGLREAWHLIVSGDPYLMDVTWVTIKVATIPTAVACVLGLPLALALGVGRFRGRGVLTVFANAGLGLPPVAVGLVLVLLLIPVGPLGTGVVGDLHLLFTLRGVYVAQTILAFPIIVALSASALRSLDPALLDQARAFGASRRQVCALALREARIGIVAAIIAAVGSGLSEVGAVVLVGGNIEGETQTLASAALSNVDAAHFATGLAIAIVLLGLIIVVTALLTVLQHRSRSRARPVAAS